MGDKLKPLKIRKLIVGPLMTNCYILSSGSKCIVVDPGGEADRIIAELEENKLEPLQIIATHGHFDHILSADELQQKYGNEIVIHENDKELLSDPEFSADRFVPGLKLEVPKRILFWKNFLEFDLAGHKLKLIHTPGHTGGSSSLVGEGFILTGDTLFKLSIGRTDIGGNETQIIESLRKLISFGEGTKIYPGHGETTDVRFEILNNSFIRNIIKKGSLF